MDCVFVSDLHGKREKYCKLFEYLAAKPPQVVLFGGDLMPSGLAEINGTQIKDDDFWQDFIAVQLRKLRIKLADMYPVIMMILGNDDAKSYEPKLFAAQAEGLITYMQDRFLLVDGYEFYGYAYVPPSPFLLKDWEKYDVSRFVDPGCISPEDGYRSVPEEINEIRYGNIAKDLDKAFKGKELSRSIVLFHSPPYQTNLDRAELDQIKVEHVELDMHIGSIAIRRFIEKQQPMLTLHGHVHESARITGHWQDKIGETTCFSAAHDGAELAIIEFDPQDLTTANRILL